ncbi:hypothetical protein SLS53_008419 [Cytospora paraplurivora]|uniref:Uncharacterized protein n=1 Tax=Cytospora paraplurivora TaxID=2898453 RepID=A0AAN9TZ26_9PEZI
MIVADYAAADGNVDYNEELMIGIQLTDEFHSPAPNRWAREGPMFHHLGNTLWKVLYCPEMELNLAAADEVLTLRNWTAVREDRPGWQGRFSQAFSKFASQYTQLAPFDFWHLITPYTMKRDLIRLVNRYIAVSKEMSTPMRYIVSKELNGPMFVSFHHLEVERRIMGGCVVQKGPLPRGAQPVRSGNDTTVDEHFFHVCPYCEECDANDRKDVMLDHMAKSHDPYISVGSWVATVNQLTHIAHTTRPVLVRIIKCIRALINSYLLHLHTAGSAIAAMRGQEYVRVLFLDEDGIDLVGVEDQWELAEIFHAERHVLLSRDWIMEIHLECSRAWEEAERYGLGFMDLVNDLYDPEWWLAPGRN